LLSEGGNEVEIADNGTLALERIRNNKYSVILLDIKMPDMSGIDLYKRIQKMGKSVANSVVFITGDVMSEDTHSFFSQAEVPYVTKPFDTELLKGSIERVLDKTRIRPG